MKQDSHKPHPPREETLVSVERQYETNVATGRTESRMFVKMYFAARDSGLLADIGDRRWRTLCCLATYMDENGRCWPSQGTIARDLGISRQRANERVQELASYRFEGRRIIRIDKRRDPGKHAGRFASNSYEILPIAGLGIFDRDTVSSNPDTVVDHSPMSGNPDTAIRPVSVPTVTANPDRNQSQPENEKTFDVRRESTTRIDRGPTAIGESLSSYPDELKQRVLSHGEVEHLVDRIEEVTGDRHSRRRFRSIAQRVPKHVIELVIADVKGAGDELRNRGAFFEKRIQVECEALEIELPSARAAQQSPPESSPPGRNASNPDEGQSAQHA